MNEKEKMKLLKKYEVNVQTVGYYSDEQLSVDSEFVSVDECCRIIELIENKYKKRISNIQGHG